MIRSVSIPTGNPRMGRLGVVTMGAGGRASDYAFDPETGLSKDARLAYYLQDLTPAQLQTALDGRDPSGDVRQLLHEDIAGTGAGSLPCGQPGNPCGPAAGSSVLDFVNEHGTAFAIGGAALILFLVVRR